MKNVALVVSRFRDRSFHQLFRKGSAVLGRYVKDLENFVGGMTIQALLVKICRAKRLHYVNVIQQSLVIHDKSFSTIMNSGMTESWGTLILHYYFKQPIAKYRTRRVKARSMMPSVAPRSRRTLVFTISIFGILSTFFAGPILGRVLL